MKFPCNIHLYDRKEEAEKAERMETELRELKNLLKETVNIVYRKQGFQGNPRFKS